jgi:hypothetical protein
MEKRPDRKEVVAEPHFWSHRRPLHEQNRASWFAPGQSRYVPGARPRGLSRRQEPAQGRALDYDYPP